MCYLMTKLKIFIIPHHISFYLCNFTVNFDPFYHITREDAANWYRDTWEGNEAILYDASLLPGVTSVNLDFVSFG